MNPPLGKKSGIIGFKKKQILGAKGMEIDLGASHLTIGHVIILINPKQNYSEQFFYPPPLANFSKFFRFFIWEAPLNIV